MNNMGKLLRDSFGIFRVVGASAAVRWLAGIGLRFRTVLTTRNLQVADQTMGPGPFEIRYRRNVRFRIQGTGAFSGIREMYVRDTYLHGGILEIAPGDVVVDLGANMGNFTNLALALGASRVVAIEPSRVLNDQMHSSLALNPGFSGRVMLLRTFVGGPDGMQASLDSDPAYHGVGWMNEDSLIERSGIDGIDFLKCDIEGGEYALLTSSSRILAMTQKIAVEIHSFAGDVDGFIQMLVTQGFEILHVQRDPDRTATVLAKRR